MHFRDILQAIRLIQEFVEGAEFEEYQTDLKTKSAIERQMEILSEAATRLSADAEMLCAGPGWPNIRGLGNVLRHRSLRTLLTHSTESVP